MIFNKLTKIAAIGLSAIAFSSAISSSAQAANLVQNGGFETVAGGTNGGGQLGTGTGYASLTNWSYGTGSNSYDFIFTPGSADTTGAYSPEFNNALKLWGTNDGGSNTIGFSPDGGNFLGIDSSYQNTAYTAYTAALTDTTAAAVAADTAKALTNSLRQTLTGLTVGQQYTVSFDDAAAQQYKFDGTTWDQLVVGFGNQSKTASYFKLDNHAFSGWHQESLNFTATDTSQVLSFIATGGPGGGQPPFVLLDGVSVQATPESSSLFGLGAVIVLGLGASLKSQLAKKK